ncbi:Uncharacterised protein [Sphingobacterium thalpophilum]|uniref:Uncharacterized protein n=1 Tax=Sphingobacterium thalpophilum TaxID=259 RepID=A0A4U9UKH7_9SPHI|nr:Uncharacterised protein [Sphingobacterium thalpophilum]
MNMLASTGILYHKAHWNDAKFSTFVLVKQI